MNWVEVASSLLVFAIFILVLVTLLYFVQYQIQKKHKLKSSFLHPLQGRFMVRYVPLELRKKYEAEVLEQKAQIDKKLKPTFKIKRGA